MTATIHYLRPFQRENLAETTREPEAAQHPVVEEAAAEETAPEDGEAWEKPEKRRGGRGMPCGRNSKWKKKIGGGVVARDKRP